MIRTRRNPRVPSGGNAGSGAGWCYRPSPATLVLSCLLVCATILAVVAFSVFRSLSYHSLDVDALERTWTEPVDLPGAADAMQARAAAQMQELTNAQYIQHQAQQQQQPVATLPRAVGMQSVENKQAFVGDSRVRQLEQQVVSLQTQLLQQQQLQAQQQRLLEDSQRQQAQPLPVVECPPPPPPQPCPAETPALGGGGFTQPCPQASGSAAAGAGWLVIGIPSAPRANNKNYLEPTLQYLFEQLPSQPGHPLYGKVKIVVMKNGHGNPHPVFDQVREKYETGHPMSIYLSFVVNTQPKEPGNDPGSANTPGSKVRQQTLDVATLMERVSPADGQYYMFMEDDFRLCPNALMALQYLVEKSNRVNPDWIVIRVCYGLNGAVLHMSDVPALAAYYRKHFHRRPPDHMLVEWYAAETEESRAYVGTRPHVTFRHNLLEHFGTVSSLRAQRMPKFAGCYDVMDAGVLFEVEAFDLRGCKHDDITPCQHGADSQAFPAIDWAPLQKQIRRVRH